MPRVGSCVDVIMRYDNQLSWLLWTTMMIISFFAKTANVVVVVVVVIIIIIVDISNHIIICPCFITKTR